MRNNQMIDHNASYRDVSHKTLWNSYERALWLQDRVKRNKWYGDSRFYNQDDSRREMDGYNMHCGYIGQRDDDPDGTDLGSLRFYHVT